MSSTNRGGKRLLNDTYSTPSWCVDWLLAHRTFPVGSRFLEPCVGDFAIVNAVSAHPAYASSLWDTVELRGPWDPETIPANVLSYQPGDFLTVFQPRGRTYAAVITNPPYAQAEQFIRRCLELAPIVCMLLRVNFLGSQRRAEWLSRQPPDVDVLSRRPSFVGGGTDSTEYAWMTWYADVHRTSGILRILTDPEKSTKQT